MYEQDKTTNTWDCINAIPNSSPEKAIINASGNNPSIKKINPEFIILYVNPLSIFNSICPESMFAANLNPRETLRARYDMNSIITKSGSNPKGHPAGTNKEKNFNPCSLNPKTVAPNTTVKLSENVNIKWDVDAKLYGLLYKTYRLKKLDYILIT
jgi:hypothetical protein